jgi:hypothetical protein
VIAQEAAAVLATFATTFGRNVDETMMDLWFKSTLQHIDADLAWSVVEVVVKEDERFPTPARFNAIRGGIERRQHQPFTALPSAPISESEHDRVHRLIAETRDTYLKPKGKR